MSSSPLSSVRVAVVGAGLSGTACAAGLQAAGMAVTLFDKSRGPGGRMATRRVPEAELAFDHGATHFAARHPRFRATLQRAAAAGAVARWAPRVHSRHPGLANATTWVATPDMPALCRQLRGSVPLVLQQTVQRLQRVAGGWLLHTAEGSTPAGPFDQVVLAMPPAQSAALLAGHHDGWADSLRDWTMLPCWTLMAATPELDWPWDAAEPERGPLAWVLRNDRKPGRQTPAGVATWVAQASAEWSEAHLEDSAEAVSRALCAALGRLLPGGRAPRWLHATVHRWRYAVPATAAGATAAAGAPECWWEARLGLGVCGDFLAGGDVEGAWRSGDELADTLAAWLDGDTAVAAAA